MNTLGKGPVPMTTSTIVTAVEQLRIGELVILPTDTVYGICADVENDAAVQALSLILTFRLRGMLDWSSVFLI